MKQPGLRAGKLCQLRSRRAAHGAWGHLVPQLLLRGCAFISRGRGSPATATAATEATGAQTGCRGWLCCKPSGNQLRSPLASAELVSPNASCSLLTGRTPPRHPDDECAPSFRGDLALRDECCSVCWRWHLCRRRELGRAL